MNKRIVAIMLVSVLILSMALTACTTNKTNETANKVEDKKVEEKVPDTSKKENEVQKAEKTDSKKLQDNFYEYVKNEKVKDKAKGEEQWDHFGDMQAKIDEQMTEISNELTEKRAEYKAGTVESGVATLQETANDAKNREKIGLGSLKEYVDAIASANSVESYLAAIAKVQKELNQSSLLTFTPEPDPKDSNKNALIMEDPNMLLEKDYMDDPTSAEDVEVYAEKLLIANGMEAGKAKEWSRKIADLHKEIAAVALTKAQKFEVEKVLNYFTKDQLKEKLPNLDVNTYLKNASRDGYEKIIVSNPSVLPIINKYLTPENLELVKNFSIVRLLGEYAPYLNSEMVKANAEFNHVQADDSELAWKSVMKVAEHEVGELYSKKVFSPEKKADVEKMVKDIVEAYKKRVQNSNWMSEEGKKGAIKKLETMRLKIAYPDKYKTWVSEGIVKNVSEGGNYIDNVVNISKWAAKIEAAKANTPVDRTEWGITPHTINGYYDHLTNDIVIPAAMLQAPFYDKNQTYAQNLGGIGTVIGHEITHAFDDNGSRYDENGNLRQWWTDKDHKTFTELSKKYIEYYGAFEAVPGHKVDGKMTLGENIADMGGLTTVSSMVADDKEALKELYTNYAYSFASIAPEYQIIDQLQGDEHSPNNVRVNANLSSQEGFYKAFDIKEGDGMYVAPEKRVSLF